MLTKVGIKNENIPFPFCSAKVICLLNILESFIFFKLSFIFLTCASFNLIIVSFFFLFLLIALLVKAPIEDNPTV